MKKMFTLLLAILMVLSLSVSAVAAEVPGMRIDAFKAEKVVAYVSNDQTYTFSDLFTLAKGVMPGDEIEQPIQIINNCPEFDYLEIYLQALPHDPAGNPISPNVLAELAADTRKGAQSEYAWMVDFLSQLNISLNSSQTGTHANLTQLVYLGTIRQGQTLDLTALLSVSDDMGNDFMGRIGEVDWQLVMHGFGDPFDLTVVKKWVDDGNKNRPKSIDVQLYCEDEPVSEEEGGLVTLSKDNEWTHTWEDLDSQYEWTVKEVKVPNNYKAKYKTKGDPEDGQVTITITNSSTLLQTGQLNWPIAVLGTLGLVTMGYGLVLVSKKRKEENA